LEDECAKWIVVKEIYGLCETRMTNKKHPTQVLEELSIVLQILQSIYYLVLFRDSYTNLILAKYFCLADIIC